MKRLAIILLLLAGCGQSGPLYIPGDPSRMTVPPEDPSNAQQTQQNEDEDGDGDSPD